MRPKNISFTRARSRTHARIPRAAENMNDKEFVAIDTIISDRQRSIASRARRFSSFVHCFSRL